MSKVQHHFFFKQVGAEIHLGCRARIEPTDPVQGTGDNLKKIPFHSQTSPESVWEKKASVTQAMP